ncbi:hypothetical protein K443DRAFT_672047 [Laccaria amethystina LaAM-08-1]|uniref:choline-phosphate cytidylyltransferase n=1 Tax=Laccaria amethystina LaAM-08-1 TaxID=1095629 RepID=A0A0C9YM16_9AGAR|nr:hypothetical protein K443DRAFT_672047 [Laccaria amethystina LaAM-08-1]
MDSTSVLSDDDYDLISNPSQRSLESSLADLAERPAQIPELPPSEAARCKFETTRWSASDVQAYFRNTLDLGSSIKKDDFENKTVRVYVDGVFDAFNVGHALQLRQAKLAFPYVHLIVGVFSDELLNLHGYPALWPEVERSEMIRHCRWVDEVTTDVPWELTEEFIHQRRIDYVAIDEGTSIDPGCDKARVKGYDEMKKINKVISTRRTRGLVIPPRFSLTGPPTPVVATIPTPAPDFTAHVDQYGIGY